MTLRTVIIHPDLGVYVGSFLGLAFWTCVDLGEQTTVCTFDDADDARDYVSTWIDGLDDGPYAYHDVMCTHHRATVADLLVAGVHPTLLGHLMGGVPADSLAH